MWKSGFSNCAKTRACRRKSTSDLESASKIYQESFEKSHATQHEKKIVPLCNLPGGCIGHAGEKDNVILKWPRHSPNLNLANFFLQIREELGLCLPLPENIQERKQRITAALETVTQGILQRVWEKLEYGLDMCRITGDANM